ncbi:MAG TPA: hypothetical protein VGS22_08235 [Thermoanaerobaculia bacterium]|jgi:ELWxxDGT repeat protein|nr:hypothetical protein [Thermoanaerobaculia bacterium]
MRLAVSTLLIALWAAVPTAAVTPYRVADIDPVTQSFGSFPSGFTAVSDRAMFSTLAGSGVWSTDGTAGGTIRIAAGRFTFSLTVAHSGTTIFFTTFEFDEDGPIIARLWATDGTLAGTVALVEGSNLALGTGFAAVPGTRRLFFSFDDSVHGHELWTTDGSVEGTHQVLDLRPGAEGGVRGDFSTLTVFRGKAYFSADDGRGPALWVSDGTAAGTQRIFGFGGPGQGAVRPFSFAALGDRLLFFAGTADSGFEPWATDGTTAGTVQLSEIGAGPASITLRSTFHIAGSLAYLAAGADPEDAALWRTDGTPAGTFPLTDFLGADHFFDQLIANVGQKVAFVADDGVHGFEPWSTDGTVAGTRLIKDVCPGPCSGAGGGAFVGQGTRLYFAGTSDPSGQDVEPWISNLSAAGTRRLNDLCEGTCSSNPNGFVAAGRFVYLGALDAAGLRQLWRTNGRTPGTVRLTDVRQGPGVLWNFDATAVGNAFVFSGFDPASGTELWRTDGSRAGTRLLLDLPDADLGGSRPQGFMKSDAKSYFFADDGTHGSELWTSDGTAGGTRLVGEREEGPWPTSAPLVLASAEANGRLVFVRKSDFFDTPELWGSDGTGNGTVPLLDVGVVPRELLRVVANRIYFIASDAEHGSEPWVTDGTKSGTRLLADTVSGPDSGGEGASPLFALGGRLLFQSFDGPVDFTFWLSDGTPTGTAPLGDVYPFLVEPLAKLSSNLVELGGKIYFDRFGDGLEASRLWVTDLSASGTREIGAVSTEPGFRALRLFVAGDSIFVYGRSGEGKFSLWATDGRPGGGRRLGRFYLDLNPSLAQPTAFGGKLFFSTSGPDFNPFSVFAELWVTNGTVAGTRRVRDGSGASILDPRTLVVFGHQLICSNPTGIWRTNATSVGTVRLLRRPFSTAPQDLVVAGSRLYFSHKDDETGTELWAFRP